MAQLCLTLCDPVDCSLLGFSVHGILQARILEWVTISFSRGSSRPRDWTQGSHIGGRHFNLWATREAHRRTIQKRSSWPDNQDGVISHLEPDILECRVKWALGNITTNKASGGDGTPAELFKILKDDAVKVLHSICQQIWKTQQWPQDWKRVRFYSNPKERQCQRLFKLLHNCTRLTR